jgi:ATP-dependent protease ClpP protease subunit
VIYLAGEVCQQMYLDLAKRLDKRPNRINVCLHSEGGDLLSGLAIYDRLLAVPDCTITATGENSSAATLILQAGKLRRATPHTQFFFHLTRVERCDNCKELSPEDKKEDERSKVHLDQVLFKIWQTRITPDNIREALARKVFGVDVALKLGIVDEIYYGRKG